MSEYTQQDIEEINKQSDSYSQQVNIVYNSLRNAEIKNYADNPWIRTVVQPKEGSSAYGPVQITKTLIDDYRKRKKDLFTPKELEFLDIFSKQGSMFLKYGGGHTEISGYDKKYDYGGIGIIGSNPIWKSLYINVAKKIIADKLKHHNGDIYSVITDWRGHEPEDKYLQRFNEIYPQEIKKPEPVGTQGKSEKTPATGGSTVDQRLEHNLKVGDRVEVDNGFIAQIVEAPNGTSPPQS